MFNLLTRLFNFFCNDSESESVEQTTPPLPQKTELNTKFDKILANTPSSHIVLTTKLKFDCVEFRLRYTYVDDCVWAIIVDLLKGLDIDAAHLDYVHPDNVKTLNELIFKNSSRVGGSLKCINSMGCVQILKSCNKLDLANDLIDAINSLKPNTNKVDVAVEKRQNSNESIEQKLATMMEYIEKCNKTLVDTNQCFKNEIINKFSVLDTKIENFENQLKQVNEKIDLLNNVEQLYQTLKEHHKNKLVNSKVVTAKADSTTSCLSFLDESHRQEDQGVTSSNNFTSNYNRYETVKFPKDMSKHPRLSVFVKPLNENSTAVAFLSGQKRHNLLGKRKYNNMELVYDSIHPNPQLAVHCINEELDSKQFEYHKRTRRLYHVQCGVDVVKSFINENL
ncbi:38.7K protein [Clanis bilineata nucleopolyhedrovirus]|uniref:38.7K protein n=1 Tax=Clanis bilineata nucleopolyhedrovirus TaxID=1307957 RepID=Q0N3Y0_9ABAC|nr:38.7K protein [Clanis bilineata nucleopolyhedrovirus]ABF47463.1 38.7K protein [Clanis bilineata nucleopolyhedrovirus]